MRNAWKRLVAFVREDLWKEDLRRATFGRIIWMGCLRVTTYTLSSFRRNLGGIHAAGLTMFSLLALVPMLFLAFRLAGSLGFGDQLEQKTTEMVSRFFPTLQEAMEMVQGLIHDLGARGLGLVTLGILFYSGLKLFQKTELSFNHIWRTTRARSWFRRIADFAAIVVLIPLLVLGAIVLSSFLHEGPWVKWVEENVSWLAGAQAALLKLVPHAMLWLAFTTLYRIMPSTKVRWRPALIAGVVTGTAWLFVHDLYLYFQIGVTSYRPVYGALVALPLLLLYMQLTWTIILVGAEISYSVQNLHSLRAPEHVPPASHRVHNRLSLALVQEACRRHQQGEAPPDLALFAQEANVPREWVDRAFSDLHDANILLPVREDGEQFLPARAADRISMGDVVDAAAGQESAEYEQALHLRQPLREALDEWEGVCAKVLASRHFGAV